MLRLGLGLGFHDDWTINATPRVFTRFYCVLPGFYYNPLKKNAPPPGGSWTLNVTSRVPDKNVASRVLTRQNNDDGRRATHDGQKMIPKAYHEHTLCSAENRATEQIVTDSGRNEATKLERNQEAIEQCSKEKSGKLQQNKEAIRIRSKKASKRSNTRSSQCKSGSVYQLSSGAKRCNGAIKQWSNAKAKQSMKKRSNGAIEQCRSGPQWSNAQTEQWSNAEAERRSNYGVEQCRSESVKQLGNAEAEQWSNRAIAAAEQISSGAMQKQSTMKKRSHGAIEQCRSGPVKQSNGCRSGAQCRNRAIEQCSGARSRSGAVQKLSNEATSAFPLMSPKTAPHLINEATDQRLRKMTATLESPQKSILATVNLPKMDWIGHITTHYSICKALTKSTLEGGRRLDVLFHLLIILSSPQQTLLAENLGDVLTHVSPLAGAVKGMLMMIPFK
ncbi:hypothetical protein DPMN_151123 [Dreissena polymorpha]|uniref:Uncharacterized protein n=1 Tax=Dreissena polymorpha TaxID=45954 RepID=A0A9D4J2N9_DREPO|nr:hypothetical protein DPMN_151123 [Dreissena polymorpha]